MARLALRLAHGTLLCLGALTAAAGFVLLAQPRGAASPPGTAPLAARHHARRPAAEPDPYE